MTGAILMAAGMALGGVAHGWVSPPTPALRLALVRDHGERDRLLRRSSPWPQQLITYLIPRTPDPADSLYFAARTALNSGDHRTAARLFQIVREQFPGSSHAGDAYYWEAFALYRTGERELLRFALRTLDEQQLHYPVAAARGDSPALRMRIVGELARGGDAMAVQVVTAAAASEPRRLAGSITPRPAQPDAFRIELGHRASETHEPTGLATYFRSSSGNSGVGPPQQFWLYSDWRIADSPVDALADAVVFRSLPRATAASAPAETHLFILRIPDEPSRTVLRANPPEPMRSAYRASAGATAQPALTSSSGVRFEASRQVIGAGAGAAPFGEPATRAASVNGRLVDPRALPQGCNREEHELRLIALQAMSRLDATAAAPMLRGVLEQRDPCSLPARFQAVTLLAARPVPATITALRIAAVGDPNPDVRTLATQYLARSRDPRAVEALAELSTNSQSLVPVH
jgi:hypothetical protein